MDEICANLWTVFCSSVTHIHVDTHTRTYAHTHRIKEHENGKNESNETDDCRTLSNNSAIKTNAGHDRINPVEEVRKSTRNLLFTAQFVAFAV